MFLLPTTCGLDPAQGKWYVLSWSGGGYPDQRSVWGKGICPVLVLELSTLPIDVVGGEVAGTLTRVLALGHPAQVTLPVTPKYKSGLAQEGQGPW